MPETPFESALVVANPIAGRGKGRTRAVELGAGLEGLGIETEVFLTEGAGDAARRVRERAAEIDLVVSVGGDGTFGEVLSTLPPGVPAAVLPMGTANVMGSDLALPRRVPEMLQMIQRGKTQPFDTGLVNGRLSFLVIGVGFDGEIVRDVERRRNGPITKAFYVQSVLKTLVDYRPPKLSVEVDGEPVDGTWAWVLISNIIGYGGVLKLSPDRVLDDGLFEVFLFPKGSRMALAGYGLRGVLRHLPGGSCKMMRARRVRVESDEPVAYEVDGDYGGVTPVDFEVAPDQHLLIVP